MARQSFSVTKKTRGRPPGRVKPATAPVRLPVTLFDHVDAWIAAQPDPKPTRPEAIRRLLAKALQGDAPVPDLEERITEVKSRLAIPDIEKAMSPAQGMEKLRRGLSENELRTLRQKRPLTKPTKTSKR